MVSALCAGDVAEPTRQAALGSVDGGHVAVATAGRERLAYVARAPDTEIGAVNGH